MIKKCECLCSALFIEIGIDSTSLNDVLKIVFRLTVAYQIYFFAAQFCTILGPHLRAKAECEKHRHQAGASIAKRSQNASSVKAKKRHPGMKIFSDQITVKLLNDWSPNTMAEAIGIEFTAIGPDYLEAKMPVDHRTHQPFGLLH